MPSPRAAEQQLVDRLTLEAANDGEALVAAARTLFCLLVLLRLVTLDTPPAQFAPQLVLLSVVTALSAASFLAARRRRLGWPGLVALSAADAAVCALALLPNVLWPWPQYPGLLRMPEMATALPLLLASALRLTPLATVVSLVSNFSLCAALLVLDLWRNAAQVSYGWGDVGMFAILLVTVGALSWQMTRGARRLVHRMGQETAQLGRVRGLLDALMRQHHDVRTLLTSARMHLQLAQHGLPATQAHEHLGAVDAAIAELGGFVEGVKSQAFAELAALEQMQPSDVPRAIGVAVDIVRQRFPQTQLHWVPEPARVLMVGGERALAQVIFNLLVNACEGDGRRRASAVRIATAAQEQHLRLSVQDDGPGFLPQQHSRGGLLPLSTKPGGTGIGLMLVADLVGCSGGRIELGNSPGGGACVSLWLPQA